MAEIIKSLQQIQALPHDQHWFCPRRGHDDKTCFFLEDLPAPDPDEPIPSKELREKRIADFEARKNLLFKAVQIFAFDGNDAVPYQQWLEKNLAAQMHQCEVCIREFHRSRGELKRKLEDTFDQDEVASFLQRFDTVNLDRIKGGLEAAGKKLKSLPETSRNLSQLTESEIYTIFECFSCAPVYENENILDGYFQEPFELVQTKKMLRMSSYTPATAEFLFGRNTLRKNWAHTSVAKFKRNITRPEFLWSVQRSLLNALARVQLTDLDKTFLPQFWRGVKVLVDKLDRELITHCLRAMEGQGLEADICKLALAHMQIDSDGFGYLLESMRKILEISPSDFWEAMGTISPSTWVEQFLNSPALTRLISQTSQTDSSDTSELDELFSWTKPFLRSIKPINQSSPARILINACLGPLQSDRYPQTLRDYCLKLGLELLAMTFEKLNADRSALAGGACLETFEILKKHIDTLSKCLKKSSAMSHDCCIVVRQALALDVNSLLLSRELAVKNNSAQINTNGVQPPVFHIHEDIWNFPMQHLVPGHNSLARNLLLGIRQLTGIEKFTVKQPRVLPVPFSEFNAAFDNVNAHVCDILESLNDFDDKDLSTLLVDADIAYAFMAPLLSSNRAVRDAHHAIIKTMTDQSSRKDALGTLLERHFRPVLVALPQVMLQIRRNRPFEPCLAWLRDATILIDKLCDTQSGLLRSLQLNPDSGRIVEQFWKGAWQFVMTIFSTTEEWSDGGRDKELMVLFVIDTMDCAETLFSQFAVFAGALKIVAGQENELDSIERRLVEVPKKAMNYIVKWLKLRSDDLLSKSVALVCKLLDRLTKLNISVDSEPAEFIAGAFRGSFKTMLTAMQKAELQRALGNHLGVSFEDKEVAETKHTAPQTQPAKKGTIDLEKWRAKGEADKDSQPTLQKVLAGASKGADAFKARQASRLQAIKPLMKPVSQVTPAGSEEFRKQRQRDMIEKKRRDAELVALRKARAGGTAPGAGQALTGLGVIGKEHKTTKGTGLLVSSDEESSDDDMDDLDRELFGPGKTKSGKEKPKSLTEEQAAALGALKPRVPVKKKKVIRSVKDMRARIAPDLGPLHKIILAWDFFHEGELPPGSSAAEYATVLDRFRDAHEYQQTFLPLLTLEAWSGFCKAKEENTSKPIDIGIINRSSVDAFLEISSTLSVEDGKNTSEGDIILLSKSPRPASGAGQPHCLARVHKVTRKKHFSEVLYRAVPSTSLAAGLSPKGSVYGLKIGSIIPLEREYGALLGLQYYDLCDEITRARPSPLLNYSEEKLLPLMKNYDVNKAQAKALKSAIDNDGFTLIQGPPGTGKTKTIVAIVGAIVRGGGQYGPGPDVAVANGRGPGAPKKKLLVCAPSNAAVDELVMRLKAGVKATNGADRQLQVVRIGRSDAINANVHDVVLEELVNKRLAAMTKINNGRDDTRKVMEEHKEVSEQLRAARAELDAAEAESKDTKEMREQVKGLSRKKALLNSRVDTAKEREMHAGKAAEQQRRQVQSQVIDEAHVICATLSGSGHDMFQSLNVEFESVVIDEAAQCVELSALIPLKYGCSKCILVGDPRQLPPTVFSREATRYKYEQSLFYRMQMNAPNDVHLLDTQYRMHPEISNFPSDEFYQKKLVDGPDMGILRARPWHSTDIFSPYRFFDVQGHHQAAPRGHSLINIAEIDVAFALYRRLRADFATYDFRGKIGVITPYKSQLHALRDRFTREYGDDIKDTIEFNTTDAFQGRECEIIIFSCVRAKETGSIGFLADVRRMNVGLTRAKSSMWVLGNAQSLSRGEIWNKLIESSRQRQRYTSGDLLALLGKPIPRLRSAENGEPPKQLPGSGVTLDVMEGRPELKRKLSDTSMASVSSDGGSSLMSSDSAASGVDDGDVEMKDASSARSTPAAAVTEVKRDADNVKQEQVVGVKVEDQKMMDLPAVKKEGDVGPAMKKVIMDMPAVKKEEDGEPAVKKVMMRRKRPVDVLMKRKVRQG